MTTKTKVKEAIHVKYEYIPKRVTGIANKNHLLYDGKLDGSIDRFSVLRSANGSYSLDMTAKEQKWVEQELGLEPGTLNTGKRNNEYFQNIKVEMPKSGIRLDISDPYDFLVDKILSAYDNIFAPNLSSVKNKRSYRYVRVHNEERNDLVLAAQDMKKEAYKLLGTLEESREKMIMYLLYGGQRLHPSINDKDLRRLVNEKADRDHKTFIKTLKDPLFIEKGMVRMGTIVKVIESRSGLYFYQDKPLAFEGKPSTLENASLYLSDKEQQDLKLILSEQIINDFSRTE